MNSNPYYVLGISPDATEDEIKKKYRELVKKYHPDLHPNDDECARKMSEVNEAYELIKSGNASSAAYTSQSYNRSAPSGSYSQNGQTYYYQYADVEDIFNAFFGGFGFSTRYDNNSADAYERIRNYIDYGDYNRAAAVLNNINDRNGKWYYYAAKVSVGMYQYENALKFAEQSVKLDPDSNEYKDYYQKVQKYYKEIYRKRKFTRFAFAFVSSALAFLFGIQMLSPIFRLMIG